MIALAVIEYSFRGGLTSPGPLRHDFGEVVLIITVTLVDLAGNDILPPDGYHLYAHAHEVVVQRVKFV